MKNRYFLIIGLLLIILIIVSVVFFVSNFKTTKERSNNESSSLTERDILNNCKNLNLQETAKCLRDDINTFYYYNDSSNNDNFWQTPKFEDLKNNGGNCEDWSSYYELLAKKLNFNADTISYIGIKGVIPNHQFTIMWDSQNYCILNLNYEIECYKRDI